MQNIKNQQSEVTFNRRTEVITKNKDDSTQENIINTPQFTKKTIDNFCDKIQYEHLLNTDKDNKMKVDKTYIQNIFSKKDKTRNHDMNSHLTESQIKPEFTIYTNRAFKYFDPFIHYGCKTIITSSAWTLKNSDSMRRQKLVRSANNNIIYERINQKIDHFEPHKWNSARDYFAQNISESKFNFRPSPDKIH